MASPAAIANDTVFRPATAKTLPAAALLERKRTGHPCVVRVSRNLSGARLAAHIPWNERLTRLSCDACFLP